MRVVFSLLLMLCLSVLAFSQPRQVTGRILNEQGAPVPFASVLEKGTKNGVSADQAGNFTIRVAPNAVLVITAIGFSSRDIRATGDLSKITLVASGENIDEVVITSAYGAKTVARGVTYNAQIVSGEKINTIRQTNLNNALAGKVAGIQVRSQSAVGLGWGTSVRINGANGFGTGGGPIYVVDGTILPNIQDINMDEIEDVTVLQGPASTALYGPSGAGGAIVVSMKKGRKSKGIGIDLNMGVTFDKVSILPNYQNSYAGGGAADLMKYTWKTGDPVEWKALDGKFYPDYSDDASWGPRMVGQEYIPWYAWYGGTKYSYATAKLLPQPNNSRDFFETGVNYNNSVAFTKVTDMSSIRVSFNNISIDGMLPSTSLVKNVLSTKMNFDLNKHLSVGGDINYVNTKQKGEINDGYSNQSTGSFNQWFHRDLDMGIMKELRGLRTPDGIYASWNHANPSSFNPGNPRNFYAANYWYNFYTWFDLVDMPSQADRLYGNLYIKYKVNKHIDLKATYRKQQNTTWSEQKFSSELNKSGLQTTGNEPRAKGYYSTGTTFSNIRDIELIGNYNQSFLQNKLDVGLLVGADFNRQLSKSNSAATNNGLNVPNLFTVGNSKDQPSVSNGRSESAYRAFFSKLDLGYKKMIYGEATVRQDYFSTLPPANNGVLSKSFGLSFVFSELLKDKMPWLSFGKIRGSWGEIPQAIGTYAYPGFAYGVGQFQWNGNFLMGTPDALVDSAIHGSVSTQKEVGLEMYFLKRRVGFEFTYFEGTQKDFPYSASINGASGFTSKLINIGELTKNGVNARLILRPVNLPNIKWDLSATWAYLLHNKVVEISDDVKRIALEGVWGSTMPYLVLQEGKEWGQIYGNGIKRNAAGVPILTTSGAYINDPNVYFGSVLPRYTGGVQNSFEIYHDFILNVNIDYQSGGKFVSLSDQWGSYSGLTARTATINDKGNPVRDAVADGGGVHVIGVDANNNKADYYVAADDYYHNLYNNKTFDPYVYDLTFVKLREISIGYKIPIQKIRGLGKVISNATFSIIARNPVLIYAKTADFDPSEVGYNSGETANYPGTRGIGVNLKIGF
ncbi:MAG: SusC/RagA family TonB-linked outer membrane protein [Bacteroidetes bacterium]|nr:SusC/RagA family TonB-linked outer membrane protein [Bacteroidota bacterium]